MSVTQQLTLNGRTIGYKMWSGLFSDVFLEEGILYVTPDYRNFPQVGGFLCSDDGVHRHSMADRTIILGALLTVGVR